MMARKKQCEADPFGSDVLAGQGKADRLYGGAANEAVWKEAA